MTGPDFADWADKVNGPIREDLTTLFHNRFVWKSLIGMLEQNPDAELNSVISGWLSRVYSTTQAVGIRRQASTGDGEVTLANVLKQIEASPRKVTLEHFLEGVPHNRRDEMVEQWKANWQRGTKPFVDSARVKADRQRLATASTAVQHYVNKRVAHLDRVIDSPPLTYDDINGALKTLGDIFKRYYRLVTGNQLAMITPIVPPAWIRAFQIPWATPNFMPPDESEFG